MNDDPPQLWAACKTLYGDRKGSAKLIRLYHWTMQNSQISNLTTLDLPIARLLEDTGQKRFSPSGMTFKRSIDGTELIIIAAAQRAYARWRMADVPSYLAAARLPKRHRQAEGLAASRTGELLIADEGGDKRARLRVYTAGALP